jgi:hypothetical protein
VVREARVHERSSLLGKAHLEILSGKKKILILLKERDAFKFNIRLFAHNINTPPKTSPQHPTQAPTSSMSLQGQTALITGGGKNLGAQIAREIADEGANLALHYNSPASKDETWRFMDELTAAHPEITISIHAGDLTTGAAVEKLFKDVVTMHGQLNIVINTVGMVLKKPMTEVSEAEYDMMFA